MLHPLDGHLCASQPLPLQVTRPKAHMAYGIKRADSGMSITIALVDDDRNILTSLSVTLQSEGFVTRLYSDGEAALKALVENPPDLAVLDIKMPRMDGMELLRRLREKS